MQRKKSILVVWFCNPESKLQARETKLIRWLSGDERFAQVQEGVGRKRAEGSGEGR